MRKILLAIFIVMFVESMLFSSTQTQEVVFDPEDLEIVNVNQDDFETRDELELYWFLTSYNLILQGKGQGGLLCFSDTGEYLAGYSTPGTPEDFFLDLPPSTLSIPYVFPTEVAMAMYASLDNLESYNALIKHLDNGNTAVILISVLKLYDPVVSGDPVYGITKEIIEKSVNASGLDIEPFYSIFEENGIGETDLVNMVISGQYSASDLALEAIRLMKESRQEQGAFERFLPLIVIVASVAFVILSVSVVFLFITAQRGKKR